MQALSKEQAVRRIREDKGIWKWLWATTLWIPPVTIFYSITRRTLWPFLFGLLGAFSLGLYKSFYGPIDTNYVMLLNLFTVTIWHGLGINFAKNQSYRSSKLQDSESNEEAHKTYLSRRIADRGKVNFYWSVGQFVPGLSVYYAITRRTFWPIILIFLGRFCWEFLFSELVIDQQQIINYLVGMVCASVGIEIGRRRALVKMKLKKMDQV
mgnify:CR=1 FL=1|tara:strand:+ start:692 stop:1321 length:630 start_codon:yes stop_codon:yes gene_type:complete